jgi:hypothetical protein
LKRYVAGLACVAAATLSAPALASTAHAQAPEPLSALKSQFRSGQGVTFVDTTKVRSPQGSAVIAQRKGVFQFGTSGVRASDHTTKLRLKASDLGEPTGDPDVDKLLAGLTKPEQTIRVGNTSYVSGGILGEYLPREKSWIRFPVPTLGVFGPGSQLVNVAEPKTLGALLAHATKSPGVYSGKITFAELRKVSPWFRAAMPGNRSPKTVVQ